MRNLMIVVAITLSLAMGFACSLFLSVGDVMIVLELIANSSALLLGVLGVWVGLSYMGNANELLCGKQSEQLKRAANEILLSERRCSILFKGFISSGSVIMFSLASHFLVPLMVRVMPHDCLIVRLCLKTVFVSAVVFSVFVLAYSMIMAYSPILDSYNRIRKAKSDAEKVLAATK